MGYTIKIGQAEPAEVDSDTHEYEFSVVDLVLPEAPAAPGDVNPHANYRWPSYSVWAEFCRNVGLYELFYADDGGLIRPHPGVVVLREHHAETIAGALRAHRAKYPSAIARFEEDNFRTPPQFDTCDYSLARLEWLDWWVRWTLKNCSRPAIANS